MKQFSIMSCPGLNARRSRLALVLVGRERLEILADLVAGRADLHDQLVDGTKQAAEMFQGVGHGAPLF